MLRHGIQANGFEKKDGNVKPKALRLFQGYERRLESCFRNLNVINRFVTFCIKIKKLKNMNARKDYYQGCIEEWLKKTHLVVDNVSL